MWTRILLFIALSNCLPSQIAHSQEADAASGRVESRILKAVVKIQTSPRRFGPAVTGSAFLVGDENPAVVPSRYAAYLVTNKHMLGDWNCADGQIADFYDWIEVFLYANGAAQPKPYIIKRIALTNSKGELNTQKVKLDPNPLVDVAVIGLDLPELEGTEASMFTPVYLVKFDRLHLFVGTGDLVFALGYPFGITSLRTSLPIAKAGYLSSAPGETMSIAMPCKARNQQTRNIVFEGKISLVDGLIVPGNSGGPVVMENGVRMRRNPQTNQVQITTSPLYSNILGIVSAGLGPSGLTVVYSADYIIDLIASFK